MSYQYEVHTLGQFLRRIAIDYVRFGYVRYALREIPEGKDPQLIDRKIIDIYGITTCRMTRTRKRKQGLTNIVYTRFGHSFVLLAEEKGNHPVFDRINNYDIRTAPFHFCDYSIGITQGKSCVRVSNRMWKKVEYRFRKIGLHQREKVEEKLTQLPYYGFPGVVRQKLNLVAEINQRRKRAGLPRVNLSLKTKEHQIIWSKLKRRGSSHCSGKIGPTTVGNTRLTT